MESFFPIAGADGRPNAVGAIVVEITERKRGELCIQHLNEVLRAVRDIGELIVRERNADRLLAEACNTLVRARGYRLVWIGGVVPGSKRVAPLASAGQAADYLDAVAITWDDSETGRGPSAWPFGNNGPACARIWPPTPALPRGESRRWPAATVPRRRRL